MAQSKLSSDDRGAVMVIAVFFAVFAVSMLFMAVGTGESVLFREHLQDAADAAALSGAVTHARIMNVLVLINMVMAALLAILVTIKLIEGVAIVGTVIASCLAWLTGGATLAAIPPLGALEANMEELYNQVEPTIFQALELLHDTANSIAAVAPEASDAVVQADIEDNSNETVLAGFAAPTAEELPVEDDAYEKLCDKAGQLALKIANVPLKPIPGIGEMMSALEGPMGTLTGSLSQWFCGDGQNSLPNLDQNLDRVFPRTETMAACEEKRVATTAGEEKNARSEECERADRERAMAAPNASGGCQDDCSAGGAYDRAVTLARETCNPSDAPTPFDFRYQLQQMSVTYTWNGEIWLRGEPVSGSATLVETTGSTPPCGPVESWPTIAVGYNRAVHPSEDPSRALPVCSTELMPELPLPGAYQAPVTIAYQQVTQIISCKRNVPVPIKVTEQKSPGKVEGNSKSPKRVTGDVAMGSESFQIRAVIIGDLKVKEAARLVRLGLWGRAAPKNPLESLRELGGFSVAQAEYFFDGTEGSGEWMWRMKWQGRLRRFELPSDGKARDALQKICTKHLDTGQCNHVLEIVGDWNELLLH